MTPDEIQYFKREFESVKEHFDDKIKAVNEQLDGKIHAVKSSVAVQNQQNRIDLEQMYSYHKEHFETAKTVTKLEASVHGVDHEGGLVRDVIALKKEAHIPPCDSMNVLKTRMDIYVGVFCGIPVLCGLVFGAVELYKKLHP